MLMRSRILTPSQVCKNYQQIVTIDGDLICALRCMTNAFCALKEQGQIMERSLKNRLRIEYRRLKIEEENLTKIYNILMQMPCEPEKESVKGAI